VGGMNTLVMGRFIVFLIERFFRRGRVQGVAHQFIECGFDIFDVRELNLEDMNKGIELDNVVI
jgi:hypothetical protein